MAYYSLFKGFILCPELPFLAWAPFPAPGLSSFWILASNSEVFFPHCSSSLWYIIPTTLGHQIFLTHLSIMMEYRRRCGWVANSRQFPTVDFSRRNAVTTSMHHHDMRLTPLLECFTNVNVLSGLKSVAIRAAQEARSSARSRRKGPITSSSRRASEPLYHAGGANTHCAHTVGARAHPRQYPASAYYGFRVAPP